MTLEQFKKNLELISQIESAKQNNIKNSNNVIKNITSSANSNNQSILNPKADKKIIKTKSTSSVVSSTKTDKSWLEEKIGDVGEQLEGLRSSARNWGKNLFKKPKAFEDGYQIGDVSKTVGSSLADAGMNVFTGATNLVEGVVKLPLQGVAQVIDWAGSDRVANNLRSFLSDTNPETTSMLSPKLNDWREKYFERNSVFGNSSDQVASGIGTTIGSAGLQPLGSATVGKLKDIPIGMGLSEMGNSVTENFNKEGVTDAQAWLNGAGKGTVSAISESIFGAFGVGGSELDDVLVKKATQNLNSQLAKGMAQLGIKAGGEAAEEFLEYAGGYLTNLATDMISQGKGAKFYEEWNSDEVLQSMLSSFVSTGITQSGGTINNLIKGNDVITGNTKQVQAQIDQEVQSQIQTLKQKGEKVNTAKQLEIERVATEKVYLNNAKNELIDIVNKSEKIDTPMKKGILGKIDSTEDFNNLNVISKMVEVYENRNKNLVPTKNSSLKAPIEKDIARQTFFDSAKTNNIDVNNNTEVLDSMFEMAYQRGVNISIDGKAFNNENQDALWRVNEETGQREIIINPNNPTKALQNITIHEMTHDMENTQAYQQLSKLVLDYAKKQNNYDNAFKELSNMYAEEYKNYKGTELESRINQEMVANILGEKLGNQEFVNSIVTSNRGVAQNIYSWVVDKLNKVNKLAGYKFEKLYWADVKSKFEKAFNSEFNNYEGSIKYQMMNSKEYGQYWHVDSYKDIFSNITNKKDLKNIVYNYILNGNKNYGVITDKLNNKNVEFIRISANEYVYGRNSKDLNSEDYTKKMRMSPSIDDLINNASITYSSPLTHKNKLFVNGFNNYQGKVEIADTIFSYIVRVGKTKSNDSIFYDISLEPLGKIKGTEVEVPSTNKSTSLLKNSVPSKYSITPNGSNVNYVNTDNQGRQLSRQQQEYFKDTKAIDENGKLLELYHGTQHSFNTFSYEHLGENTSSLGAGFYFTDSEQTGNEYTRGNGELKKVYLNIQKPMTYGSTTMTKNEYKDFITAINNETNGRYIEDYGGNFEDALMEYDYGGDDIDLVNAVQSASGLSWNKTFEILRKSTGYDGIISEKGFLNKDETIYVVFNPNQIKNVDNTNPTNNDDIRYSKSNNSAYQQFLQDNFSNDGTKTYMKDIKLPSKVSNLKNELRNIVDTSADMDSEMKDSLQKLINDANTESELESYKEDLKPNTVPQQAPVKGGTIKITNYKNAKLNSKIVNNALSMTEANKQGRRTKSQWLQVAEQIGMNIKENEIDKYAYKTWSDFLPNQKNNLNRQGEKYVKFTRDEWIKAVEDGYYKANVEVKGITKEESQEIQKVIEDKDISSKSSDELWNELVNNSSEEAQELLDGRNIEIKQGRKNTKAISNDKSIEISKSGNMYLNNSKPTAEQYRNGLEYHFEKGEKRLVPSNKKQVQEGYNVEEWTGNQWEKSNKIIKENNILDEESPTLKYLKDARSSDKASFNEIVDSLIQKFVNRGHYIDKLAKETNNPQLKYANDKTLSTFAEAQYSIGIAQTDNNGNEIGKSLIDVFKPVKEAGLSKEFNDYLLNRLNIERQAVEKSLFGSEITSETSRNEIRKYENQYPQFKVWAEDVYRYNNNELQNLVDAGFISKDTQELFHSMYGDYVPIHRILEETVNKASKTTKETGATSPIKRAKGGFQEILDIETAMAENVLSSKKSIRMNELGIELAKSTGNQAILEEIGYQPKWTPDAIMSLNGDVILNEDGRYLYNVYINGELKQFNITEELYEGLRKDTLDSKIRNNKVLNTLLIPVEKLTKAQRDLLTTYSIGFALNNPIKDFQDGLFYTKYSTGEFLKNYTVALQEIANKGDYYKKYMALGGMDNSYFEYGSGIKSEVSGIKKLFNKIQKINGILETAPRLAEYITSIQNGATQNEAMYNASDITTNFKRGGELTKIANKYGANFLNASVQGLDKFVRTFTNLNTKSALKLIVRVASMGILPTLLNGLLYKDDDDYEKLEDYIKDEYYLIKISDDGDFIRIPKGRVLATISSATRTMIDSLKDGGFDLKGFTDEATKQLAPNNPLEDNLLAPVMQVANNKTWYGTDLVPSRLQNQLPKNQFNEKTDKISLWIGENLNISPIKINYLIDQYSGGIGDVILPMLTPQAENNILTDKFTTSSITKNKTVGEFYDALDEYQKLSNDSKATEEQKTKYAYLSKISSKVGELYSNKREIQMDSSLTDKEKKELVKEIQKEINAYTECAVDNINGEYTTENKWNMYVDGIISDKVRESDGNSALQDALYIINNGIATKEEYMESYQLCKDNGTSIPTMSTLVKLKENNVKLTSYTDFKLGTKEYEADKNSDGKTISGSLSAKKATYIMDMEISKEQKNGLLNVLSEGASYDDLKKLNGNYGTYFKQSGKTPTTGGLSARDKYMSLINAGISVDELNTFYEQIVNISAIKDENGKTISGSKKQLVFNFINSLKLSIPQKMILLAKQYNSFGKKYIKEILQYISVSDMTKQDKIKLIYMLYKS